MIINCKNMATSEVSKIFKFKKKKNVLHSKKEFNILTAKYEAFRVVSC